METFGFTAGQDRGSCSTAYQTPLPQRLTVKISATLTEDLNCEKLFLKIKKSETRMTASILKQDPNK